MDKNTQTTIPRWYRTGTADQTECSNCGRERVIACTAPDGSTRRVCSKCQWDQQANTYANHVRFPGDELMAQPHVTIQPFYELNDPQHETSIDPLTRITLAETMIERWQDFLDRARRDAAPRN